MKNILFLSFFLFSVALVFANGKGPGKNGGHEPAAAREENLQSGNDRPVTGQMLEKAAELKEKISSGMEKKIQKLKAKKDIAEGKVNSSVKYTLGLIGLIALAALLLLVILNEGGPLIGICSFVAAICIIGFVVLWAMGY